MMLNISGTCATTRLVQCRSLGVYENDISRKFDRDPEDVRDLSRDDFIARKIVLDQTTDTRKWWAPILYKYEVSVVRIPYLIRLYEDISIEICG